MKKLQIRGMHPEDRTEFEALMRHRPGYDADAARRRTDVIWHIAFRNPVSDGRATYFVATDGERILCHMGRMPTRFWLARDKHLASFAHDLFAHPELQANGSGFFTTMKLYKTVEDACESFAGLLWTNELNIKLQQARKYDQLWVKRHARPLEVTSHLRGRFPEAPAPVVHAVGKLSRFALGAGDWAHARLRKLPRVFELLRPDDRLDRLAEEAGPHLGIAPVKDAAYVRWKYFEWPGLPVTVLAVGDERRLRRFVALRDPSPGELGRVLDLSVLAHDLPAQDALISAAIGHFRRRGASGVDCIATSPVLDRALRRAFFVKRPPDKPLFFLNGHKVTRSSPVDREYLKVLENWGHVYGDSEGGEVP